MGVSPTHNRTMKKNQFIHLHGLLAQVANHVEDETGENPIDEYAELGTEPTSIHRSKDDHKEAVMTLLEDITNSIETDNQVETQA